MFIDTSGWFCLLDENDRRNSAALDLYDSAHDRLTHSYIISELVGLATSRWRSLSKVLSYVDDILNENEIRVVWVDEVLTFRALDLLRSRIDKAWSLCDAVSFVIMDDLKIVEALTTDRHFQQAGFVKLLDS